MLYVNPYGVECVANLFTYVSFFLSHCVVLQAPEELVLVMKMTDLIRIKTALGVDKRVGDSLFETALAASGRNGFPAATSDVDRALMHQWCDFCVSFLNRERRENALKLLDSILMSSMYLCGRSVTPADVVVFVSIRQLAASLSFEEKEKYLHFGRWFQYMQDYFASRGRQGEPGFQRVVFSKIALS